jgi:hypothetical protein
MRNMVEVQKKSSIHYCYIITFWLRLEELKKFEEMSRKRKREFKISNHVMKTKQKEKICFTTEKKVFFEDFFF